MSPQLDDPRWLHELSRAPAWVAVVVLIALVLAAAWAATGRGRLSVPVLLVLSALWLRTNGRLEGDVLLTVTPNHGLTVADLAAPALVGLALATRHRVRRRRSGPR